ncbi:MAG: ATP synthase subunit b [Candidatus Parcubacteria bacterium]|nr:MAG: ATP synthase subunit b [Candidatus Parcubacteria bacterium]
MNSLQLSLGIDYKILILQIINFALLFFVIYYFFSKPISKIIEERKQKIEEGLKKREEVEKLIQEVRLLREKIIEEAENERINILKQAQEEKENLLLKTREEINLKKNEIYKQLKIEENLMKEKLISEMQKYSRELFIDLARKIFNKSDFDQEFIKKLNG